MLMDAVARFQLVAPNGTTNTIVSEVFTTTVNPTLAPDQTPETTTWHEALSLHDFTSSPPPVTISIPFNPRQTLLQSSQRLAESLEAAATLEVLSVNPHKSNASSASSSVNGGVSDQGRTLASPLQHFDWTTRIASARRVKDTAAGVLRDGKTAAAAALYERAAKWASMVLVDYVAPECSAGRQFEHESPATQKLLSDALELTAVCTSNWLLMQVQLSTAAKGKEGLHPYSAVLRRCDRCLLLLQGKGHWLDSGAVEGGKHELRVTLPLKLLLRKAQIQRHHALFPEARRTLHEAADFLLKHENDPSSLRQQVPAQTLRDAQDALRKEREALLVDERSISTCAKKF